MVLINLEIQEKSEAPTQGVSPKVQLPEPHLDDKEEEIKVEYDETGKESLHDCSDFNDRSDCNDYFDMQ